MKPLNIYVCNVEWLAMLIAVGHPGTGIAKMYLMYIWVVRSVHTPRDKLYLLEVVQRVESRVKLHYIGYDDSSDEWHELDDVVTANTRDPNNSRKCIT